MTNLPPYLGSDDGGVADAWVGPGHGSTTSAPRWMKVFDIIVIVLVLLFVIRRLTIARLTGRGLGGHTPPIEHGGPQP